MGYRADITEKALKFKLEQAKKHRTEWEAALNNAYNNNPRLSEIDLALSKSGANAAIKALQGDNRAIEQIREVSTKLQSERDSILKKAKIKPFSPLCPICNDTGFADGHLCSCVKQFARQMIIDELSQNMPLESSTFSNFDLSFYPDALDDDGNNPKKRMTAILNFCKEYADGFSKNSGSLLFTGGAGLGKTHLSLAICNKVLDKGYGVVYSTAGNLTAKLEKEYFSHEGSRYLETLCDSDLVVIDDLGTEFLTQFSLSSLYNVINSRILSGKPTIINTNLSFVELEERYTARIASRLAGEYTVKRFLGNDIRIIKATK